MGAIGREARWPSPPCVLRGYWKIILQVTARSRLSVLTPKNPSEQEGGREARGPFFFFFFPFLETLSAVIFFFLSFLRESSVTTSPPQHHHSVQLITGFALFLRFSPQRITCQINFIFALLPTSHSPLLPHRKPCSLRLDILQTIYVVFRIVIFF